jgi:endonuclease YncB( thermonuclease family)
MRVQSAQSLRIAGVNCPELFSGTNREAGAAARDFTMSWLKNAQSDDSNPWGLLIITYKDKQTFNRYVADVYDEAGKSLAEAIITANHGEPS